MRAAAGSILEVEIPISGLDHGSALGDVSFFIAANDANQNEVERHPTGRPIELAVPDERFEARNWSA